MSFVRHRNNYHFYHEQCTIIKSRKVTKFYEHLKPITVLTLNEPATISIRTYVQAWSGFLAIECVTDFMKYTQSSKYGKY